MALNVILVLLAVAEVRSSLAELQGLRKVVAELGVERFRASKDYRQMEAIFSGLIALAATDADARRIVNKFQIENTDEMESPALGSETMKNLLP